MTTHPMRKNTSSSLQAQRCVQDLVSGPVLSIESKPFLERERERASIRSVIGYQLVPKGRARARESGTGQRDFHLSDQ